MSKAFTKLMRDMRACALCAAHLPLEPRPIFQLSQSARILVVGQAPGSKTHDKGIPFDDASGNRLRDWMGVSRDEFYDPSKLCIFPMGLCYPGTGSGGDLPPRPECAATWRSKVMAQLPQIELTLVIGQYAMDWHLDKHSAHRASKTLTETVANWRAFAPSIIPMPHPSPRNQRWLKTNPWFGKDVVPALQKRVRQLLKPS